MQLEMGDIFMAEAVTSAIGWVGDAMGIFLDPPAVYFVGFAVVGAAAGVARKFVPMKRK